MLQVQKILKDYILEDVVYEKISALLLNEMNKGLKRETNPSAVVKMFPTYVRSLPDGSERGNYLALDLGGTNFRVLLIRLLGNEVEMENKIFPIPQEIMTGKGTALFDHIAECIWQFLHKFQLMAEQKLPLGFTFSFPCKQEALNVGRLVRWTKGFNCEGVEGQDVVRMLQDAIKRRKDLNVRCVALLNDTVGCLMSCAYLDHSAEVGVILGTGTNACYMEKLDRVNLWDDDSEDPKQVIINTEWGAFGDDGSLDFIRTEEDIDIDRASLNPRKQIFEKMISGMYMGEITRHVLMKCVKQGLLFEGRISSELNTPGKFYTKYCSEIDTDLHTDFKKTRLILDELGLEDVSDDDCRHVKMISAAVSERAAFLASAGIATLLNRIDKRKVTVAVDGSLYRYHPRFHQLMMTKIRQLVRPNIDFQLMLSEDGSGKGAALVAAVAARLHVESLSRQQSAATSLSSMVPAPVSAVEEQEGEQTAS